MSEVENQNNISIEDYLSPPKYDAMGLGMALISAFIVSIVSGVIIILIAWLSIGRFSLESGFSPILLAMITFFGLTLGNILYAFLLSKIFPDIYTRGRTALSQIVIMSILLYILLAPVYLIVSNLSLESSVVLMAFALHVLLNTFCLQLIIGLTAQYRYALLVLYSSVISLLVSILLTAFAYTSLSTSSNAIFLLLGLVIVAQTSGSLISSTTYLIYRYIYTTTGYDPIGSVFARIEQEEKILEGETEKFLTQFHK